MSQPLVRCIDWQVAPGNSGFVIPLDTTRMDLISPVPTPNMSAVAIAAGSPFLVPGVMRRTWAGYKVSGTIRTVGGNNITVHLMSLTDNQVAAADWEDDASGTIVVVAGTTQPIVWTPTGPDFSMKIDAGATGPTRLIVRLEMTPISGGR